MTSILSGSLLTASLLLGQTGEPPLGSGKPGVVAPPIVQQTQPSRPFFGRFAREDRPVLSRIQSWFRRDDTPARPVTPPPRGTIRETEQPPLINPPIPPVSDFPRKLPNPSSKAPVKSETIVKDTTPVQQAASQQPAAVKVKSPILPQNAEKIGRDDKFEWITGQLEIENGNYVLYYATPETIDTYKGRIVLSPQQIDMNKFRRGDLVSVRGQLVQRPAAQGMVPLYRLTSANLIERPKQ